MAIASIVYRPHDDVDGLTWGKWVDGRLAFYSFREGGAKANFAVRLKWGWLPVAFYVAIPLFSRWFRAHRGRLLP